MITLDIHYEDGQHFRECRNLPLRVGRGALCDLRLVHWRIAKAHFLLSRGMDGVYIEDLGSLMGTRVNDRRITRFGPLKSADICIAGPCKIFISDNTKLNVSEDASVVTEVKVSKDELKITDPEERVKPAGSDQLLAEDNAFQTDWSIASIDIRRALHASLIQALDLRRHDVSGLSDIALRQEAEQCVEELIKDYSEIESEIAKREMIKMVVAEAVGLGVLEPMLADPDISEIMVNRYDLIYVERNGKILRYPATFSSDKAVRSVIDRIVFPLGRRIDESSPMVDARLNDGSRINAVIAPVSIHGACLTIRKFSEKNIQLQDLVNQSSIDTVMAQLFQICIDLRLNMIVSGGTGSGQTTLLNILAQNISPEHRIITIEDSAELQIHHPHVVSLESRPANSENSGQVSIRDLVRNAMRMRPDRIVVGEVRGPEALDMLVAMNTGHEGSLTTLHANSPRDALARLETLILMANVGLPIHAIREQLAASVNIIIQQNRLACGRRLVSSVSEITGLESGVIQLQTLISFNAASQEFQKNALPPAFFKKLDGLDNKFIHNWFS